MSEPNYAAARSAAAAPVLDPCRGSVSLYELTYQIQIYVSISFLLAGLRDFYG